MRLISLFFILFLSSCASKFRDVPSNPSPIKNKFNSIDSNKDLLISKEEYDLYEQAEYNLIDPVIWFSIILALVFLFSVVLGYFIKNK